MKVVSYVIMVFVLSLVHCNKKIVDEHSHDFGRLLVNIDNDLSEIQHQKLRCLYMNGINSRSFHSCTGKQYSKVKKAFLDHYNHLLDTAESIVQDKLTNVCEIHKEPCEDFSRTLKDNIKGKGDLFKVLENKRNEIGKLEGVNETLLDYIIDDFKRDYTKLDHLKPKISRQLLKTVYDIKNYIKDTQLKVDYEYYDFDPHDVFEQLNYQAEPVKKSGSFNGSLVKELESKKLLSYYIANGMADSTKLDFTKLPSELIKDIKANHEKRVKV